MTKRSSTGITEQTIQAILMDWILLTLRHELVIPNPQKLLPYEMDLASFTRGGLLVEWEIKLDHYDFKDDAVKPKHKIIPVAQDNSPAYFNYVTYNFSITPPAHAGWVLVRPNGTVAVMKEAPRHNTWKMGEDKYRYAAMTLSKRMARLYPQVYLK